MNSIPTKRHKATTDEAQVNEVGKQLTFLAYVAYAISQERSNAEFETTTFIYDSDVLMIWSDPTSDAAKRYFRKILKDESDQEAIAYWSMLEAMRRDRKHIYWMAPEHYQELISAYAAVLSDIASDAEAMRSHAKATTIAATGVPEPEPGTHPLTLPRDHPLSAEDALELLRRSAAKQLRGIDRSRRLRRLLEQVRSLATLAADSREASQQWPFDDTIYGDERYTVWLEAIQAARSYRDRPQSKVSGAEWNIQSPIDPSWNDIFDARVLRALEEANARHKVCPDNRRRVVLITGSPTMHLATSRMPAPTFLGDKAYREDSFGFHFVWDVCRQVTRLALARSEEQSNGHRSADIPHPVELLEFFSGTARKFEDIARTARDTGLAKASMSLSRPLSGLLMELSLWSAFHRRPEKATATPRPSSDSEVEAMVGLLLKHADFNELSAKYAELSDKWGTLFRTEAVEAEIQAHTAREDEIRSEGLEAARQRIDTLILEARSELISSFVAVAYLNLRAARSPVGALYRGVPSDLIANDLRALGLGPGQGWRAPPTLTEIEAHLARFVVRDESKEDHTPQFFLEFALICAWLFNDWALAARFAEHARYLLDLRASAPAQAVDASLLCLYCRRHASRNAQQLKAAEEALQQLAQNTSADVRLDVERSAIKVAFVSFWRFGGDTPKRTSSQIVEPESVLRVAFLASRYAYDIARQMNQEEPYKWPALIRTSLHQLLLLIMSLQGRTLEAAVVALDTTIDHLKEVLRIMHLSLEGAPSDVLVQSPLLSKASRQDPPEMLAAVWAADLALSPQQMPVELLQQRHEDLQSFTKLPMSLPYDQRRLELMINMYETALRQRLMNSP